jgi:hypothetical protein
MQREAIRSCSASSCGGNRVTDSAESIQRLADEAHRQALQGKVQP